MKKLPQIDLVQEIRDYFRLSPYMDIISWADAYINYADDVSAQRDKIDWDLFPYQKEIIAQWNDINKRKQVTVVAVEQLGKSNLWIVGLLWSMVYNPSQSLVVYPSSERSAETNLTKIQPLIKHIPRLERRAC